MVSLQYELPEYAEPDQVDLEVSCYKFCKPKIKIIITCATAKQKMVFKP